MKIDVFLEIMSLLFHTKSSPWVLLLGPYWRLTSVEISTWKSDHIHYMYVGAIT